MSIEPIDWNVVIVGHWNPAILTPAGILENLFQEPPGTPVEVQVPLDGLAPYKVKFNRVAVLAGADRLIIEVSQPPEWNQLALAASYAINALEALPRTPVRAAGINVRFKVSEMAEDLIAITKTDLEEQISDGGHVIIGRLFQYSITFGEGSVNLSLDTDESGTTQIGFNFDRKSFDAGQIVEWLRTPIDQIQGLVESVNENILNLPVGGPTND